MTYVILFSISLGVCLLLLFLKWITLHYKTDLFIFRMFRALDPKALELGRYIQYKAFQVIQSVRYIALVTIPNSLKEIASDTKEAAEREYNKKKDLVLGKKEINQSPSASFYLKRIKEDKDKSEGGRIEDIPLDELPG